MKEKDDFLETNLFKKLKILTNQEKSIDTNNLNSRLENMEKKIEKIENLLETIIKKNEKKI